MSRIPIHAIFFCHIFRLWTRYDIHVFVLIINAFITYLLPLGGLQAEVIIINFSSGKIFLNCGNGVYGFLVMVSTGCRDKYKFLQKVTSQIGKYLSGKAQSLHGFTGNFKHRTVTVRQHGWRHIFVIPVCLWQFWDDGCIVTLKRKVKPLKRYHTNIVILLMAYQIHPFCHYG